MRVRRALVVLLVLCAASALAATRKLEAFTYYSDGRFVIERADQLEASERRGVSGGHQPWRLAPALVAAYEGRKLRPADLPDGGEDRTASDRVVPSFRTVGGRADYGIAQLAGDRAVVTLKLDGKLTHRITLRRPFGHWWYITEITDAAGVVTAPPLQIRPAWTAKAPAAPKAMKIPTGLAVADDGSAVVTNGKYPGTLYFLDGATGRTRWTRSSRFFFNGLDIDGRGRVVTGDVTSGQPNSDNIRGKTLLLDRGGQVRWRQDGLGSLVFSPDGRLVLNYDTMRDFGLRVRSSEDGRLLWQATPETLGRMARASFSRDGSFVLVQGADRVSLYTDSGERAWSEPFAQGVRSASVVTARDASTAVVLTEDGQAHTVTVAHGESTIGDLPLLAPPSAAAGGWQETVMRPDGRSAIVWAITDSGSTATVQAVDLEGHSLWSTTLPTWGGSPSFQLLTDGTVALVSVDAQEMIAWFMQPTWRTPQGVRVAGKVADWRFSPDGTRLAVLVGGEVQEYAIRGQGPGAKGQ